MCRRVKIFSSGRTGARRRGAARGMSCPPCSAGSPNTAAGGCAESSQRCKTRKTPGADVFHRRRAFFTEGRNPRYAESAEWAGFPQSCFGRGVPAPVGVYWVLLYGRSRAPPLRGQSGYSAGTGIPRLYAAERSRARRGAFGAPVGAGLCPTLFYPRASGLPSSSAAVSSSPR